jgi:hypothetical protein
MEFHVCAVAAKLDAFQFEPCALLFGCFTGELDLATCAEDAVPWELIGELGTQKASDGAMILRVSGSGGNLTVGADSAGRDGKNHLLESVVAVFVCASAVAEEAPLRVQCGGLVHPDSVPEVMCGLCFFSTHTVPNTVSYATRECWEIVLNRLYG